MAGWCEPAMLAFAKLCGFAAALDVILVQNVAVVMSALLVWLTSESEAIDGEGSAPLLFERHPIDGQPIFVGPRYGTEGLTEAELLAREKGRAKKKRPHATTETESFTVDAVGPTLRAALGALDDVSEDRGAALHDDLDAMFDSDLDFDEDHSPSPAKKQTEQEKLEAFEAEFGMDL